MRRILLVLSLAGLTVLASAGDVFAQRRGIGGFFPSNGGGFFPSNGGGFFPSNGGYYPSNGYYGDSGYSPYYQSYRYSNAPNYYYSEPTQIRPSYYSAPVTASQSVNVTVIVPRDAKVWFENRETAQQGTQRSFQSPPLESGHSYTYTVKASWTENGQAVTRERRVNVQAGQSVTVNFRENSAETLPTPVPNSIPRD